MIRANLNDPWEVFWELFIQSDLDYILFGLKFWEIVNWFAKLSLMQMLMNGKVLTCPQKFKFKFACLRICHLINKLFEDF